MSQEEKIQQSLTGKFNFLEGKIKITRPRRLFLEVAYENFQEVFAFAVKELKFSHLVTITGLDQGENLGFIYHLAQDPGVLLNLHTSVEKREPVLKTITAYFPSADIYERELVDLFGARVQGLTKGNRYPLTDDWPDDQFPLRKDWKPSGKTEKKEDKNA